SIMRLHRTAWPRNGWPSGNEVCQQESSALFMTNMFTGEKGCAQHPGVVSQRGAHKLDPPFGVGQDLRARRAPNEVDPGVAARSGPPAAYDHDLGPQDIHQASQAQAQIVRGSSYRLAGHRVAVGHRLGQVSTLEPAAFARDLFVEDGVSPFAGGLLY